MPRRGVFGNLGCSLGCGVESRIHPFCGVFIEKGNLCPVVMKHCQRRSFVKASLTNQIRVGVTKAFHLKNIDFSVVSDTIWWSKKFTVLNRATCVFSANFRSLPKIDWTDWTDWPSAVEGTTEKLNSSFFCAFSLFINIVVVTCHYWRFLTFIMSQLCCVFLCLLL